MELIIAIAILIIILVGLGSLISRIYNRLVMLKFNVDKAFANIDVLLKQRADEIPNLITTVKEYASYEKETLQKLTDLRTQFMNAQNPEDKVKKYNELQSAMSKIFAVAENYPELKANNSFLSLQQRVSELEDHISDRREFFNESVNMYNIGIKEFPNLLIAGPMGYHEKTLLQISEQEKKYDGVKF
ncbi:MAG: LemA family protein [Aequorivita sp.]